VEEEKRGVHVWRVYMAGGGAIGCEKVPAHTGRKACMVGEEGS
jgi:hypothetical protein